ncbi:rho guanine nucleotide exchange factor 25-like [Musca domestica]|uniref:Rho guanine nucleotide exchange factor 25-like n=1 Tax=Musca domestica TaxID=7370 RepID=A0A1I8N2T8_MUSDO|nr:rho guanine nucleotide exchange factor 25-like [Musca domestica]
MDTRNSVNLGKLETTLTELIASEKIYVEKLSFIVEGYLQEFRKTTPLVPIPEDLKNHKGIVVFCNIEDIFYFHTEIFLQILTKYRHCTLELGKAIVRCDAEFQRYAKYCNNIPTAEHIVKTHDNYFRAVQEKLNLKWQLRTLLHIPTQRLEEYKEMTSDIVARLQALNGDWETMEEAHDMIVNVGKHIYELSALVDMKNYEGDIYDNGKLLYHEYLYCEYGGKIHLHYVFLFHRLMVFTDKVKSKDKNGMPCYTFCLEIPMNRIVVKELLRRRFSLSSTDSKCTFTRMTCHGRTMEVHNTWLIHLRRQLQIQAELIDCLVNPTYGNVREVAI